MEKILLSEREAAEAIGMTPRTLQKWRHEGGGPPYRRISARCVRYPVDLLKEWATRELVSSTSEVSANGNQ